MPGEELKWQQLLNLKTKTHSCEEIKWFTGSSELTLVMADQLLQGAEGVSGRDVESSIVQCTDLIMFNCVTRPDITVPDGQRVAAYCKTERNQ